jgi:hypothetical protein
MLITLVGLLILITILSYGLHGPDHAPYLAAAVMMVITVILSF